MRYIAILLLVALVTACANTQTKEIIKEQEFVVLKPPKALLEPVPLPDPPEREIYMLAYPQRKVTILTDYLLNVMFTVDRCNNNIRGIKEYQDKVEAVYGQER